MKNLLFILLLAVIGTSCYKEVDCSQVVAIYSVHNEDGNKCYQMSGCDAAFFQDSLDKAGAEYNFVMYMK